MTSPQEICVDIGEVKLARAGEQLSAFLGSCVSIILWHGTTQTAVMSHILLPFQPLAPNGANEALFADGAWRAMQLRLAEQGIDCGDCVCYVVGGAQFVDGMNSGMGEVILRKVQALLDANGITISERHVGGNGYRVFSIDAACGRLHVRQNPAPHTNEGGNYASFAASILLDPTASAARNPDAYGSSCGMLADSVNRTHRHAAS